MSPQIQVSVDLHVALLRLMKRGEHTTEDVIWRLVEQEGIPRPGPRPDYWTISAAEGMNSRGGFLPNGLRLRMRYKRGPFFYADVRDGSIWIGDQSYGSPSAAAAVVARESGARRWYPRLDGWKYWEYEFPAGSGAWHSVNTLRLS